FHTTYALYFIFFSLNQPATTELYTLSLHDALPISPTNPVTTVTQACRLVKKRPRMSRAPMIQATMNHSAYSSACSTFLPSSKSADRKSTRLNSSHQIISYAVFCLKKKNTHKINHQL